MAKDLSTSASTKKLVLLKKPKPNRKTVTTLDQETLLLIQIVQQSEMVKLLKEIKVILLRTKK